MQQWQNFVVGGLFRRKVEINAVALGTAIGCREGCHFH